MKLNKTITVILLLASFIAQANEPVFVCDVNCSSIDRVARLKSMQVSNGESFSVLDLKSGDVKSFRSVKSFDRFGEIMEAIIPIATTANGNVVRQYFMSRKADLAAREIVLPPEITRFLGWRNINSSIEIVINPQLGSWIADYLSDNIELKNLLAQFVSDLASQGVSQMANATFENNILVSFSNSSTAEFRVKYKVQNSTYVFSIEYVEGSAKLADGTPIPRSPEGLVGNWYFESLADSNGFIRLGALWGIELRHSDTDVTCVPKVQQITCRRIGGEGVCEVNFKNCD